MLGAATTFNALLLEIQVLFFQLICLMLWVLGVLNSQKMEILKWVSVIGDGGDSFQIWKFLEIMVTVSDNHTFEN